MTQTVTAKLQQSLSIKDFGAVGDGASHGRRYGRHCRLRSRPQRSAARVSMSRREITCLIIHSHPPFPAPQNVLIYGDGPASSLVAIRWVGRIASQSTGATGFGLTNLSISFGPTATARTSGYAVDIETCTTCLLDGVSLNNGDLSGSAPGQFGAYANP